MTSQVRYCNVDCNWNEVKGRPVEDVVIFQYEEDVESGSVSTPYIPPEGRVTERLECVDNDCQLVISSRPPEYNFHLGAVDVLCSARHMEVFSSSNEYLETSKGVMVQELEDNSRLFCLQYSFEKPVAGCRFNLKSLQTADRVWFHSIYVTLVPGPRELTNPLAGALAGGQAFDMEKVKSMMGETELSKGAQQLMASLEAQKSQSAPSMANLGMMMQMFSQMSAGRQISQGHPKPQSQGQRQSESQGQGQSTPQGQGQSAPQGQGKSTPQGQGQSTSQGQGKSTPQGQGLEQILEKDKVQKQCDEVPSETKETDVVKNSSSTAESAPLAKSRNSQPYSPDTSDTTAGVDDVTDSSSKVDPMEKMLKTQLENMENRMVEKIEKLIKQSEERLYLRVAELWNQKTQGDSLGLD